MEQPKTVAKIPPKVEKKVVVAVSKKPQSEVYQFKVKEKDPLSQYHKEARSNSKGGLVERAKLPVIEVREPVTK